MQYRKDPRNGNALSILGLGCMRFPHSFGTSIDMDKTEKLICEAIEHGVNYLDTAYAYSGSEVATGKILFMHGLREKVYLATKLPHLKCKSPEDFDRFFSEQLKRLQTTYIDYYLIHNISDREAWERLQALGIEEWIATKKAEGQIRQIGFSFHGAQTGFLSLLDAYDWDFCQIQYNYVNECYQAGRVGLKAAYDKGMAVIIMEPLLGGKLATGLPKQAVKLLQEADKDLSAAAWALRWVWNQPEATVVLSGMNSLEQLIDNVKTANEAVPGMLTEKETSTIERVVEVYRSAYKVLCTECNYCMPCPNGVNIPGCFAAYNTRLTAGLIPGMSSYVTGIGAHRQGKSMGPGSCIQCGICEKKCPQNIKVTEELKKVKKKMEPFWFGPVIKILRKIMN